MILRSLGKQPDQMRALTDSAWALVEQAQLHAEPPLLLIPQPAHAVLAGELADSLLPAAFGELPANIRQAIRMHDTGWGLLDAEQIQRLRSVGVPSRKRRSTRPVRPGRYRFCPYRPPTFSRRGRHQSMRWRRSLPECACIVSSHFSLLATTQDRPHSAFRAQEESRRAGLIKRARLDPANLERWTDALGFCDLLSLYLCSGVTATARIPRVHPARKSSAPPLQIVITGEVLRLSEPLSPPGPTFQIHGLLHPFPASGSAAQTLSWSFS